MGDLGEQGREIGTEIPLPPTEQHCSREGHPVGVEPAPEEITVDAVTFRGWDTPPR